MNKLSKIFSQVTGWFGVGPNRMLENAAREGDTEKVKKMLRWGADIHVHNEHPLRAALAYRHKDTVKALLEGGANPHADDDGPIWCAQFCSLNVALGSPAYNDYEEILKMMEKTPSPPAPS
jgi:hypothetical protein